MSDEDLKTKVQDLTMDIGNLKVDIFAMNGKISEIVEVLSKSAEAASAVKGIEELELRMFHDPNDMKVRSGIRPGAAGAVRLGAAGAGAMCGEVCYVVVLLVLVLVVLVVVVKEGRNLRNIRRRNLRRKLKEDVNCFSISDHNDCRYKYISYFPYHI